MSCFQDRVALITGGSRGIGRATALRLAAEGAHVGISYAAREADARSVLEEVEKLGRRGLCVRCDVSSPDEVRAMVAATRRELGPVELLVHCGAISNLADHTALTYELWRRMIDVNLNGTYLVIFAVKDQMIERGFGRIVTVSSVAALGPRPMQMHYAAAKAGVIALTRCCGEAFAPHNVRINCIAPGLTETEMVHVLKHETIRGLVAHTPMGRIGQPEEMASVIRFLLSDQASFMTGQTLVASGGRMTLP